MKITKGEYMKILNYYDISMTSNATYNQVKAKAEEILSNKLCRHIKPRSNSIALCVKKEIHRFTHKRKPCKLHNKTKRHSLSITI